MKSRITIFIAMLGSLALPGLLWGQAGAASAGKIGVLNLQEAIATTAEGKKAFEEIQKKYQPRQQDLQRQQQEITALNDQLQRQAATLSDEERMRLSRELEDKQKIFKRATEDANADFQADNQDAFRRLAQKVIRIVNEYAPQNGFALIMEETQIQPYFLVAEYDITAEIVRRFDAANPVEGAPAAAAPANVPTPRPAAAAPAKPADKPKP